MLIRPGPSPLDGATGSAFAPRWLRLDPLRVTAWSLLANTALTSVLGMVFWGQASRRYPRSQVGEDAALLSVVALLSTVAQLNLSTGIPRLLPQVRERRYRPVALAYAVTAAVAVVTTALFVTVAPQVSDQLGFLRRDVMLALAVVVAVVLSTLFALQDAVLVAVRLAGAVPLENAVFGVAKLGLMMWLAGRLGDHGIFVAWLAALAVLVVPVNALLFGRVLRSRSQLRPGTTVLPVTDHRLVARYLAVDYAAALLGQGSTALLPLIVVAVMGSESNAYFYMSFLVVVAVSTLAYSLSLSIVAEGAYDESGLAEVARRSVVRYTLLVLPVVVVLVAAAPAALAMLGPDYATRGTTLLRLLLAGTVPQAVVILYLGVERIRARVRHVLAVEAATLVLLCAGAVLGMRAYGLDGAGWAWLTTHTVVATVVVRPIWRLLVPGATGQGP